VAVKVTVVGKDERESGERAILNYGHTLGHALEATVGYGTLLHGEAVAIGMDAAARIAQRLGMFGAADVARQRALLEAFGLPTAMPVGTDPEAMLDVAYRDKKVHARHIRWVLPTGIGGVTIRDDVPDSLVLSIIRERVG
jgi:3-dehydroquinate synthase